MPLRKVNVFSSALTDNAASFTNVTSSTFDLLKLDLATVSESTAGALGDAAECSIDEVTTRQSASNDSRNHIMHITAAVIGGTGAVEASPAQKIMSFRKGDLELRSDDSLFMNNTDVSGALDIGFALNIWYDD